MAYSNKETESKSIWEWLEIDDRIIQPGFQSFFLMACRGNFDFIRWDKLEAQRINNWFESKIRSLYWARNPKLANIIKARVSKTRKKFKNFESEWLLGKALEFALEDLFKLLFEWTWIQIFKASEYDDIFCWIDYIAIWNWVNLWIDLKISSRTDLAESKWRKHIIPTEFNLYNWKWYEIRKSWEEEFPFITDQKMFWLQRKLLQFEPNLAQLFLYEYMQLIKTWFDGKNNKDLARKAWAKASERYQSIWPIKKWVYIWMRAPTLVKQVELTSTNLFAALI